MLIQGRASTRTRRQLEVHVLEEIEIGEILAGDLRDRDVVDVEVVLLDEEKKEVERPLEDVERCDVDR